MKIYCDENVCIYLWIYGSPGFQNSENIHLVSRDKEAALAQLTVAKEREARMQVGRSFALL